MVSGNNDRFLRLWHEIAIGRSSIFEFNTKKKWFPLQKGGGRRFWYGNLDYVINWENDGDEIRNKNMIDGRIRSHNYNGEKIFLPGITWNSIGTTEFVCRYAERGFVFDAGGPLCTINDKNNELYMFGLLRCKVADTVFRFINPTINYTPGTLLSLPVIIDEDKTKVVTELCEENITIAKEDWNAFESSWDFCKHPLI